MDEPLQYIMLAIFLSIALSVLALFSMAAGILLFYIRRLRFASPFVSLVPSLASLGAVVAAWVAADLDKQFPFRGWVIGFVLGSLWGSSLGLWFALRIWRGMSRQRNQQEVRSDS